MKTAICLLCVEPYLDHLDFFKGFRQFGFDVFVLADSNASSSSSNYEIDILRVEDKRCIAKGYHHFNTLIKSKPVCSAWDKALYFFCDIYTQYDFVWLIEEDLFVPEHNTLLRMNSLYKGVDLIACGGQLFTNRVDMEKSEWQHWEMLPKRLDRPPYVSAMCCALRISRAALLAIKDFAKQYHDSCPNDAYNASSIERLRVQQGLPFLEITFPMIVVHKGLSLARPRAMADMVWGSSKTLKEKLSWNANDSCIPAASFKLDHMYHPIKQLELHKLIREQLLVDT